MEEAENYLIQPWDKVELEKGIDVDLWLPPQIDKLAQQVCNCYDMKVRDRQLITTKSDKGGAIWKITTDRGNRSLKVLHRKSIRSAFSIGAQDYIVRQGGRVPRLVPTKEGNLFVEKGGKLWIVTDWIEALIPAGKDIEGARDLCHGLGEFHQHSKGYSPPLGSQRASRLFRWPEYYRKIIKKIEWFKDIAKAYCELPNSKILQELIEIYEKQAQAGLAQLEQSSYLKLVAKGETYWGLVHQDFGWSNGQLGPDGLWVIDLDGVAFDLPIRDLRKLISSTMDDLGYWDATWIRGMIDAYHQTNPLDRETYKIFLIDLAFPNEFYKYVNEILYDPINFINLELGSIAKRLNKLEKTKCKVLDELKLDVSKYRTGDYQLNQDFRLEIAEQRQLESIIKDKIIHSLPKPQGVLEDKNDLLKVLMICTEKLPVPPVRGGAIQTYINGISANLSEHCQLTILGTTDPTLPVEEIEGNIHYVRVDGEQVLEIYAEKVIKYLSLQSFDIIHVFNRPRLVPLIRDVAAHSRIILSMHNDMFTANKIAPNEALAAINEVEKIITVSNYVGNTIISQFPEALSKVQTIYSGVDLNRFVPWKTSDSATQIRNKLREDYKLQDKTVILFVGRLTPKKGTDLLLKALNRVYAEEQEIALVIVGGVWYSVNAVTDYVAYIRSLAEKSPYPVITTGYIPADLIHQWFWAGDIFVCPSQWQEPLARVHYEAMAAGMPFITTARGGNPEVVMNQNGLLVESPEDPQEFAEQLKLLINHPEIRQKMGQRGRMLAEERFGWERVASEVLGAWKTESTCEVTEVIKETEPIKKRLKNKNKNKGKGKKKGKGKDDKKTQNIEVIDFASMEKQESVYDLNPSYNCVCEMGSSVIKITKDMICTVRTDQTFVRQVFNPGLRITDSPDASSVVIITREMIQPSLFQTNSVGLFCHQKI